MQGRRSVKRTKGRWDNSQEGKRRRRALADARREERVALLPPAPTGPDPLTLWQVLTVELYVPTSGRCDQHAVKIDGAEVGLLSASEIGVAVRHRIRKRPSHALLADVRQELWRGV